MMEFELVKLGSNDVKEFEADMQEAFNKGAEYYSGQSENVLPKEDIEEALNTEGAVAYKAMLNGIMVGGTIVNINSVTGHNHLDFLYVKDGYQGKKVGQRIWHNIQQLYPETKIWETCTPYFDQRNIHFYINRLGFHAVEFYNQHHLDPTENATYAGGNPTGMFRFEKIMNQESTNKQ